jgi:hypothetical protein
MDCKYLECGCVVSCKEQGGLLVECGQLIGCKFMKWHENHHFCEDCGRCDMCGACNCPGRFGI